MICSCVVCPKCVGSGFAYLYSESNQKRTLIDCSVCKGTGYQKICKKHSGSYTPEEYK
jgi:DnaJ-class molecular chaperone